MHGTMFVHLRNYVEQQLGSAAWPELLDAAELGPRIYLPIKSYPDEELVLLVGAAAKATAQSVPALLEKFGEAVAPHLLAMYRHLLKPEWRTLDVLENVEATAHRAVRIEQPQASPPYLQAERNAVDRISIRYTSARRLCHVAKGIIRGLAKHYAEPIALEEPECMHHGAAQCLLVVRLSS
jgi:predicted hydrocarbon binding protein